MVVIIPARPERPVVVTVTAGPAVDIGGGANTQWGQIQGSLSNQLDLQAALDAKQATLVSATNIKTINGVSVLGAGDLVVSGGGGGGATNLAYDAATRVVSSDTGTDATLTLADGTNAGLMTSANFTKLAGVATGATANSADATLLARANHTGTQAASTISNFNEAAQDAVGGMVGASLIYDDPTPFLQRAALTGDVTALQDSNATTIAADAVTNTKLANMATSTFKGRITAATGDPEDLTVAQAKTVLAYTPADIGAATSAQANATHTGDATGATALTIAANAVDNTKAADMATARIKGRVTAATGDPEDLTGTQATTLLDTFTSALKGLVPASGGGTANFLRADGTFAPPAGGGDMVLASAQTNTALKTFLDGTFGLRNVANTFTALFTNTITAARTYTLKDASGTLAFTSDITGTNSGTNTGDQTITLTGDLTGSGTGSFATTLATVNANTGSWGLAASVAQFTVNAKGLITAAANVAISIASTAISDSTAAGRAFLTAATTAAQTALLDVFGVSTKGLVPSPAGVSNTTDFLRRDGTWAAPSGGGGVSDGDKGDITVSASGAAWKVDPNIKYGLPIVLAARAFNL